MKVSQQKIAERLNLSVSTVSRALRNDDSILPTTRARIFRVASDMGYRPKFKRAHAGGESISSRDRPVPVIGVYAHEPEEMSWTSSGSHEAGHYMLSGISAAAAALGAQIYFQSVRDGEIERILAEPSRSPSRLRVRECSGALLLYLHEPTAVEKLIDHFPCVSLVNRYSVGDIDTVGVDADTSIGHLVGRLYSLGHRRIGFVNGRARGSWVEDRFAAYVKALMQHRLEFDPRIAVGVYSDKRLSVDRCAQELCEATRSGVTAWVCSHDITGYQVCRNLRGAGIRIPEDVSVVGFDGVKAPEGESPLSTVVSPLEELGEAGMIRVLSRIKDPTMATRTVLLKCRLSEGQTVGPARVGCGEMV